MIELDELLSGDVTPSQVSEYFSKGDFDDEEYLVKAIKRHLRDEEDKATLARLDLTIEDCLNGRVNGEQEPEVLRMYEKWNQKLGFHHFGH
jgi:hypothetical protein